MTAENTITKDAIRVARRVVDRGFWYGHTALTKAAAVEISQGGTLWFADLDALEKLVGRALTKQDHLLWETTLRSELTRLAPLES